ncbi:hypothetical protein TPY_0336 [Sulfobacillus acidophilus TPY]|nr:hypothetical protein TPY_0336 [Sulfobacillus acidophilus TPY]
MYPWGRPHNWQRWYFRTLYFGVRFALAINDFLAIITLLGLPYRCC